jgi:hypothetical protein
MTDPINAESPNGQPGGIWPKRACDSWGPSTNTRYISLLKCRVVSALKSRAVVAQLLESQLQANSQTRSMTVGSSSEELAPIQQIRSARSITTGKTITIL